MNASGYEAPRSVEETIALLQEANGSARILAGGTDLLAQMKTGVASPDLLIDIEYLARGRRLRLTAPTDRGRKVLIILSVGSRKTG